MGQAEAMACCLQQVPENYDQIKGTVHRRELRQPLWEEVDNQDLGPLPYEVSGKGMDAGMVSLWCSTGSCSSDEHKFMPSCGNFVPTRGVRPSFANSFSSMRGPIRSTLSTQMARGGFHSSTLRPCPILQFAGNRYAGTTWEITLVVPEDSIGDEKSTEIACRKIPSTLNISGTLSQLTICPYNMPKIQFPMSSIKVICAAPLFETVYKKIEHLLNVTERSRAVLLQYADPKSLKEYNICFLDETGRAEDRFVLAFIELWRGKQGEPNSQKRRFSWPGSCTR